MMGIFCLARALLDKLDVNLTAVEELEGAGANKNREFKEESVYRG
jgi:hypothetical protein